MIFFQTKTEQNREYAFQLGNFQPLSQEAEKAKLQLTARQQLAMQKLQEQPDHEDEIRQELAEIRRSLNTVGETIADCCEEAKYAMHDYMNQEDCRNTAVRRPNPSVQV